MDNIVGYPLKEALKTLEENNYTIINIVKVTGTNKKFNKLDKPYVIRKHSDENSVTLYVSYF